MLQTISTFVDSLEKFIGVFDNTYEGGDFCAGITFGYQGIEMMERVALNLYDSTKAKSSDIKNDEVDPDSSSLHKFKKKKIIPLTEKELHEKMLKELDPTEFAMNITD